MDYHERLLRSIAEGEVFDKVSLQRKKIELCREMGLSTVPPNSETLSRATEEMKPLVKEVLRRKDVRTLSGVAVVAVMTSPAPCPHGRCTYCPGGVDNNSPQSYTGKEPAARRASHNEYDPYKQVTARLQQLEAIGHATDKVDLIIMGGTFTSRPWEYQVYFVKSCFDAMNLTSGGTLEDSHRLNEGAPHRCIGMTVETRPDSFDYSVADRCLYLGTTRVELGVQILDDEILRSVNRGHGVEEIVKATKVAREKGLKICYHIMPGLPGSNPEKDLESFRLMFNDERFRPDMLKIYPTLVVKGTPLYDKWKERSFTPYSTEQAVEVIAKMKAIVPRYVRIQRIQRDIPVDLIEAGVDKGHLREIIHAKMRSEGRRCGCIRCREVGLNRIAKSSANEVALNRLEYKASSGKEAFISLDLEEFDALVGYIRLRLPLQGDVARVRELKVFGQMERLGVRGREWQHRGFGKELMAEAEDLAAREGYETIAVTSGVGVRRYYASLGYTRDGPYMIKKL
ncbi:MAG: tRNA uridine(34) 5-carboxymethylaminomethyl modification radical SAM/GNAT enzyme Elp3 [Methanomassiliicoccales archaeon]